MKVLLNTDEMIEHMKTKGIKFQIISEQDAKQFLEENNYYMKLASYRTNYQKSKQTGKYINLDFAYLKELSTLDMHLRYLIIEMCLDLEHAIKVKLLNDIEKNPKEDGYELIRRFLYDEKNSYILKKIRGHNSSEYCKRLIEKYYPYFPVWVFVELISFGDLTYLCAFYNQLYGIEIVNNKFMNEVRDLRNAAAHSNCLINRLFDERGSDKQVDSEISGFIKNIKGISKDSRTKNLKYCFTYNFVTFIYVYNQLIKSKGIRKHRYEELKELVNYRMVRNKNYFQSNSKLRGIYVFLQKVVDSLQD